jgi:hypothetical protein
VGLPTPCGAVTVDPIIDYTAAPEKLFVYERLRPPLLHCTHDGLERLSE